MLDYAFSKFITSRESQKLMFLLAQALSMNIFSHLRFKVSLWNTTDISLFFKCTYDVYCTTGENVLHMKMDWREHGLVGIIKLLVRSDYTWKY